MLATQNRLRKKSEIDRLWKHGRSFVTPIFSLKYAENKLPDTRATVVVSTKVDKRAVVRNKVKRRLREALRPLMPSLRPGMDILITTRKGIEVKTFAEMRQTLEWSLQKTGLLRRVG